MVTDGEKSKAGKKRAKAPRVKLLSQYSQVGQVSSVIVFFYWFDLIVCELRF